MKVLIIDGYNLIYRSKYSFLSKGRDKDDLEDRSIVYSFARALRAQIEKHRPDFTYFVLEGKPVQRLLLSESYKAQRVYDVDPGFNVQRKLILELVRAWPGLTVTKHPQHECDDVVNEIAKLQSSLGNAVVVVSTDTDFCQSITDTIHVYNPITKKFLISPVLPHLYPTWKALKGDPGDNIIGFKGVGEKRATQLAESKNQLDEFLKDTCDRKKFETNLKLIQFEEVDLIDCVSSFTEVDPSSFDHFHQILIEYNFDSVTADKSWKIFIKPIKNLRRPNAKS
jgi:DNA polymerase-1